MIQKIVDVHRPSKTCSNQSPSRAPRAATRGGCFAAARAACVSTWLGEVKNHDQKFFALRCGLFSNLKYFSSKMPPLWGGSRRAARLARGAAALRQRARQRLAKNSNPNLYSKSRGCLWQDATPRERGDCPNFEPHARMQINWFSKCDYRQQVHLTRCLRTLRKRLYAASGKRSDDGRL